MRPRIKTLLVAGLVATVGAIAWYALVYSPRPRAPDFSLADLDGTPHALTDYRGQVVVVNFWASWCRPCREEIPMLVDAQHDDRSRGLRILGIALDTPEAAADFARKYDMDYPVLAHPNEGARVQDAYTGQAAAGVLPYTVIVDRNGRIAARVTGRLDRERLDRIVGPLLAPRGAS